MAQADRPLRLGVVGCGAVTARYHLPALLASKDIEIVAFVDPVLEHARQLARRADAEFVLSNHQDLVGKVDAVIVAVPNAFHAAVSSDLLQSGVHVLVEKPMARSTQECDDMLAAVAATGTVLAVGHDFRHYPVAQFTRRLFESGLLGAVRRVDVQQSAGGRWPAVSTAVLSPQAGGGVLIDFGVHMLDLLLWWLGDMRPLAYRDDAAGGVESECQCELVLDNGASVYMELSRSRSLRDTMIVECQNGTVEIGIFEPAVVRLSLGNLAPVLSGGISDPEFERAPLLTVFARQLSDFVTAIRASGQPLVSGHAGRRVVALVEACYAQKQPLRLPWDYPEAYQSLAAKGV
jgi:predicted dehydrogenase